MANYYDGWSEDQKRAVWEKGIIVPGYEDVADMYRQDVAGAWISYPQYGATNDETNFGWEIDHIFPEALGGNDSLANLRPLQWRNNRSKSDNYPRWSSEATSNGTANIKKTINWVEKH